jgi:choline dehydrogenase-like flavoprotein
MCDRASGARGLPRLGLRILGGRTRGCAARADRGVRRVPDVGDPAGPDGVAPFHANVRDGVRWNAAFAFLDPLRGQPNVTTLSDVFVDRLVIEADRAVGLSCLQGDRRLEIAARRFVVCAGALAPQRYCCAPASDRSGIWKRSAFPCWSNARALA